MFIVTKISYCLLKSATFTYPTKPVRDKVPFVTRSLVTEGGRGRFFFYCFLLSTLLDNGIGRLPSADAGSDDCPKSPDCVWGC